MTLQADFLALLSIVLLAISMGLLVLVIAVSLENMGRSTIEDIMRDLRR